MRALASILALSILGGTAAAADQTVLGRTMGVKDPLPGVNPSKRSIKVVANEPDTDNVLVGDPLADGATVEVIVNGATSTSQTFSLPAGPPPVSTDPGWSAKVVPGEYARYRYQDKNGEASAVTLLKVYWRNGRYFKIGMKARARGNNPAIDVLPGNPTSDMGIRLTLGTGDTYCVLFGGAAGGLLADRPDGTFAKAARPTGEGCPVAP